VRKILPELAPIFVRVHTRVEDEKPRGYGESQLPDKWARFALVLDCETTRDLREDLNFLWWRFCELKDGIYVCQQEGVVYADALPKESKALIRSYAASKRADVENGCPQNIKVQSRTKFVDGESGKHSVLVPLLFASMRHSTSVAWPWNIARRRAKTPAGQWCCGITTENPTSSSPGCG
jgi:hypothetical protein